MNNVWTGFLQDLICGTVSGIGNCLSGYIFDTLKVRMQMSPELSMFSAFRMIRKQGYMHLFNGLYYPLITIPIINAVVFGAYETYKLLRGKRQLTFLDGIQNGAFAGLVNTVIVSPVEMIKCIMQNDQTNKFKNSSECAKIIIKEEGIKGLFRGTFATAFRQIFCYAGQFAAYQFLKSKLIKDGHQHLEVLQSMVVGMLAGVSCWLVSYPQDIIKTHLQVQAKDSFKTHSFIPDGGFFDCGSNIRSKYGWGGFWKGIQPCILRAAVANAVGIALYQKSQKQLRKSGYLSRDL